MEKGIPTWWARNLFLGPLLFPLPTRAQPKPPLLSAIPILWTDSARTRIGTVTPHLLASHTVGWAHVTSLPSTPRAH